VLTEVKATFISSQIMAWTVSPNIDELECIVPSTINPLGFEQDVQQINMELDSVFRMLGN